jgi:hypothetical protein
LAEGTLGLAVAAARRLANEFFQGSAQGALGLGIANRGFAGDANAFLGGLDDWHKR